MLLDNGANVNALGGYYGSAPQVASYRGYEAVVQLLLNARADVNALGGEYGCALQAASLEGRMEIVRLLLHAGADVNSQSGKFGSAIQAASYGGRHEVVRLLLGAGADVNITGGTYGNALQATFSGGVASKVVAPLLLDAGADVNVQGGYYGNALQAASYRGDTFGVRQLLDAGAEINAKGGEYQSSILAASLCGHVEVMELLIETGAEVKLVRGDGILDALESASRNGREDFVRLLLAAARPIDKPEILLANALHGASDSGNASIRRLLLDAGADPNVSKELLMQQPYTSNLGQTYYGVPPAPTDLMPPKNWAHHIQSIPQKTHNPDRLSNQTSNLFRDMDHRKSPPSGYETWNNMLEPSSSAPAMPIPHHMYPDPFMQQPYNPNTTPMPQPPGSFFQIPQSSPSQYPSHKTLISPIPGHSGMTTQRRQTYEGYYGVPPQPPTVPMQSPALDEGIKQHISAQQNKDHNQSIRQKSDKKKRDAEKEMETLLDSNGIHISGRASQIMAMVDLYRKMAAEMEELKRPNDEPSSSQLLRID